MDLNDTPELAEYRTRVRAWLAEHAAEAPARAGDESETSSPGANGSASSPRPAWRRDVARRVRRPGPRPAAPGRRQPGDRPRGRAGHPRRHRRRHARPDDHRPRLRGAEAALPRPDAARRRGLVPAVLRARRRLGPRRDPDPRAAPGRRQVAPVRPEGVDDQRAVRRVRPAARAHRRRRAQAQGPDDVHRPDGRRGRDGPPAAADLRRRALQRGLLRRRRAAAPTARSGRSTAAGASR